MVQIENEQQAKVRQLIKKDKGVDIQPVVEKSKAKDILKL